MAQICISRTNCIECIQQESPDGGGRPIKAFETPDRLHPEAKASNGHILHIKSVNGQIFQTLLTKPEAAYAGLQQPLDEAHLLSLDDPSDISKTGSMTTMPTKALSTSPTVSYPQEASLAEAGHLWEDF
eukprot:scaffold182161_cov33-Prasinocladus_malaysianus.AAC.1